MDQGPLLVPQSPLSTPQIVRGTRVPRVPLESPKWLKGPGPKSPLETAQLGKGGPGAPDSGVPVPASEPDALVERKDQTQRLGTDAGILLAALRQHCLRIVDVVCTQPHPDAHQEPDQAAPSLTLGPETLRGL